MKIKLMIGSKLLREENLHLGGLGPGGTPPCVWTYELNHLGQVGIAWGKDPADPTGRTYMLAKCYPEYYKHSWTRVNLPRLLGMKKSYWKKVGKQTFALLEEE